jgi:EAL domain-containing protein (putative c-di-GMP-specific phosphodiesterase class I)/DNA-binding response OmpR family regulator
MVEGDATTAGRRPVVLVVDDDASVRALFALVLDDAGCDVLRAGDGREALDALRGAEVDLVLLDASMPGMDGHATLAAIRDDPATAATAVLLVTGTTDVADRIRGLDAGADDYLEKPVDPEELVARVRAHLRGRDLWRRSVRQALQARTGVAQSLGRITAADPVTAARTVCLQLEQLAPGTAAAIVSLPARGEPELLAGSEAFRPGGAAPARVPRPVAAALRARAATGPWIEERAAQAAGAVGVPLATAELDAAAYVPLVGDGGPFGLLVLAGPRTTAIAHGAPLSAALDLAPLVAALLRPLLADDAQRDARRAAILARIGAAAFHPVFQPILDLDAGQVVGYEALTRFADGAPPEAVFAEAAAAGVGLELEAATARAALAAARDLPEDCWVSVNVSPSFLTCGDRVAEVMATRGGPVVLELTEHDPIDDYAAVLAAMAAFDGDELRLSVDDAGAGYACLHHVLQLRPAFVKLDRGWVAGIGGDPARQALVAGLGAFAERTGGCLIAEGIEEPSELATLAGLRVPLGQGWLLGRPVEIAG